jgi:hypothetical protein
MEGLMDDHRVEVIEAKLQSLIAELSTRKEGLVEALRLASRGDVGNVRDAAHACSYTLVQFEAALDEARQVGASPKV